jgi:hypothetical protein
VNTGKHWTQITSGEGISNGRTGTTSREVIRGEHRMKIESIIKILVLVAGLFTGISAEKVKVVIEILKIIADEKDD